MKIFQSRREKVIGIAKYLAYRLYIKIRVPFILQKNKIKVLFVLAEASTWKTELLYTAMLKHVKFVPVIGITTSQESNGAKETLVKYLNSKKYEYIDLDVNRNKIKEIKADFVFYYKPYEDSYPRGVFFKSNPKSIPCSVNYGFPIDGDAYIYRTLWAYSYYFFTENEFICKRNRQFLGLFGHNQINTGVPMMDLLSLPKDDFNNPWHDKENRKKIIYAPHHSIPGTNGDGVEFATILIFGESILNLAKKYSNEVYFAFKPHPNLRKKLNKIWGENKTDNYYNEWASIENSQFENGEYLGLFKHSNAIIHDSCSFIVEYQYTNNPSLFLINKKNESALEIMNEFGLAGLHCHEKATCIEEIEQFIINVIKGEDNKKKERNVFMTRYLTPPNNATACENIINVLLSGC